VASTKEQIRGLLGSPSDRVRLARGKEVELQLDSGEVVDATLASLRSRTATESKISAKAKTWTRWSGTPDDLVAFLNQAATEIAQRSSDTPAVSVRIGLSGNDEERYFDASTFEGDLRSTASGAPGGRLKDIDVIELTVGPTRTGALKANAIFSRLPSSPGVVLALEGADRTVVSGLKEELAPLIEAGKPRVPALPGFATMFVGGLAGIAYGIGFWSINWDFMPNGWIGGLLVTLLYLVGFIGLIYAVIFGLRTMLPPLTITRAGTKTQVQQWSGRITKVSAALGAAVLPFILDRIFGK
jgi:hypothetical protein